MSTSTAPATAADLSAEWYYVTSSGEQAGPVNIDELRYLYHKQQTNNDCLCWTEQLTGWTRIGDVTLLQAHFTSKAAPPPLPPPSTIQLSLPPLNTSAQVAPAPASTSPSHSGSGSGSGSGSASGKSTMSRKTGQLVAQHAKYKTMKKERGGAGGGASVSMKGSAVSDMLGAAQKKYGTLKVGKSTGINSLHASSPTSPSHAAAAAAQAVLTSGDASVASPRNASTSTTPTFNAVASSASNPDIQITTATVTSILTPAPAPVDTAKYPPSQSPDAISHNLITAITSLDSDALTTQLAAGDAIQLDEQLYIASPLARMYAAKLDEVRCRMREAVRTMDEVSLCQAVYAAEAIGYGRLDVVSCRKLRDAVIQLNVEAKQQLVVLNERKMRNIISRAEQLSITSPQHTTPTTTTTTTTISAAASTNSNATIEQLRILLDSTSEEKFRQLQLKAANALGDRHRATRLTIALKQLVHKRTAHMFTLDSYAKWRDSDEWASEKLLLSGKRELAEGMKRWTRDAIHTSLTRLSTKELNKLAVKAFKRLLVYCGDRTSSDGGDKGGVASYDVLREMLDIGLQHKELRDELFIQLMKQLTANPNTDSERRVWTAMYCALETFPPNSDLENILEIFLSKHVLYGSAAITMLHHTLYDGARRCVPSEAEVAVMAAGKSIRHCAYEDEREYYTWRAVLPKPADVQRLAGTTAAGMKEFIESGCVPDWSEIDIRIPAAEHWQQPEFKLEVKVKKQPPSPQAATVRVAAPSAPVVTAAAAVMAPLPVVSVSSSQLSTAINSTSNSRPVTQPSTPRNARLVVDTAAPPPLLSTVTPLSPLPLSPLSPSMGAPLSPTSSAAASFTTSSASISSQHHTHSTSSVSVSSYSDTSEPPPMLSSTMSDMAVPPPPPPAAAARAVCAWAKTLDASSGQYYYYHTETMEVTWDQPADYFE